MREILFRGKAIDDNWYYGVPLVFTEDYVCMTAPHTYNKAVIPKTVGQYTGLTDKNGKKIFEGDIVSTDITRPYLIVEFRDGCFMFNCNDGGKDYYAFMLPILNEPQTQYLYGEVIGNIHDNPELLKGE